MKKFSLIISILAAFCLTFVSVSAFSFDSPGAEIAFGNSAAAKPKPDNTSETDAGSNAPSWVNGLNSSPTATPDPDATPSPTATPAASPAPTSKSTVIKAGTKEAETLKVPILLYHHISNDFDTSNAISIISPKDFRLHMTAIKAQFTPVSLRDYVEFVNCRDGSKTMPQNPIIVTFDDGYLSNYEVAYPILKELEIPATIFVVTDTVGAVGGEGKVNYSHFTWEQAKEMVDSGLIDIQSHTNDHVKLGTLNRDAVNFELRKSKYLIEKNLDITCDIIAYPYGSYNDSVIEASHKAGYKAQCLVGDDATHIDYEVNIPRDGVEHMTRITVSGLMGNVNVIELVRQTLANKTITE